MTPLVRSTFSAVLLATTLSCGSSDDTSVALPGGEIPAGIPLQAPGPPVGAELVPIPEEGGTLELAEGIRIIVPKGGVGGELSLAHWRPPAVDGVLKPWEGRVRPLGEPFAFSVVGQGFVAEGRLEADIDDLAVGKGWEVGLLHYAPGVLPLQIEKTGPAADSARVPWMLTCDNHEAGETLITDLLALMPESKRERYFQLVAVPEGTTRDLYDRRFGTLGCIHVLDPPVHDDSLFVARVEAALRTSVDSALAMGFKVPAGERLSVTIIDGPIVYGRPGFDRQWTGAATVGGMIVLRNDLHTWLPRTSPGVLERAVAHEFFHFIQYNSMTEATLNSVSPGGGNLWAIEGAATWFARAVYPEASRGLLRPDGTSLKDDPYAAWAFWAFLEEKVGRGVVRDVYIMSQGHALVAAGFPRRGDLKAGSVLVPAYDWLDLAEALNAVLSQRDLSHLEAEHVRQPPLSAAYEAYAVSLLYRGDFAVGDVGDALHPGLWHGRAPMTVHPGAVTRASLVGTREDEPLEWDGSRLIGSQLSAHAIQLGTPLEGGDLYFSVDSLVHPETGNSPKFIYYVFLETPGAESRWNTTSYVHSPGSRSLDQFRTPGGPSHAVLVLVNPSWTRWRPATADLTDHRVIASHKGEPIDFKLKAYLHNRPPPRLPVGPKATVQGSGKTYCVSKRGKKNCQGTINQALSNPELEPGDIIEVGPGLYEEHLKIEVPVNIVGTQPGNVVLRGSSTVIKIEAANVGIANFVVVSDAGVSTDFAVSIYEADNSYMANNVIIRENGGGIVAVRSSGTTVTDNWVATPRWGIRVWDSPGSLVVNNVVMPATVRPDIQNFRITANAGVEWPGDEPWVLTEPAIDIVGSAGIVVTDNVTGPATTVAGRGYETAIKVVRSSGVELSRNTAFAYNEGIFLHQSSTATLSDNRAAGLRAIVLTESDRMTVTRNRAEGHWIGLAVTGSENIRLVGNHWTGSDPTQFAVQIDRSDEISVLTDSVFGRRDGRGGMWVRGGTGLSMTDSYVSGWSLGLEVDSTSGVGLTTSTFEQRRHDDHPAWASAALALKRVRAAGAQRLTLRGEARALLLEQVARLAPEQLAIEVAPYAVDIITARDADLRATDVWIHSEADRMFVAENARLSFVDLSFGVPDLPPLATFHNLEFVDGQGGPVLVGTNVIAEETSVLSQERDLSRVWPSDRSTLWLPFQWHVQNGRLEIRASLDVETTPLPVSGDIASLDWRQQGLYPVDQEIHTGASADLDTWYSGTIPLTLRLVLPRHPEGQQAGLFPDDPEQK